MWMLNISYTDYNSPTDGSCVYSTQERLRTGLEIQVGFLHDEGFDVQGDPAQDDQLEASNGQRDVFFWITEA